MLFTCTCVFLLGRFWLCLFCLYIIMKGKMCLRVLVSVWCFDWMSLSAKEAQQISCLLDKHQTTESVWRCVYTDNQWVVLSTIWTLTLINHSAISINFFSLSIVQTWLAGHDQLHMLCMIHILYISDMTLNQEIAAPRATEMLTVHTCGVKMNHMCAVGRNLPVFSERDIQQFCHEHFYGLRLL